MQKLKYEALKKKKNTNEAVLAEITKNVKII